MKTTPLSIAILFCLFANLACNQKQTNGNETTNAATANSTAEKKASFEEGSAACSNTLLGSPNSTLVGNNLTAYETAKGDIKRYQDFMLANIDNPSIIAPKCVAFDTHDLLSALGITVTQQQLDEALHARCYFGMDVNGAFKFYVVPVVGVAAGHMGPLEPGCDALVEANVGGQAGQFVYELNFPCPNVCAKNNLFD